MVLSAKELEPGTAVKVLCGTPEFVAPEVIFGSNFVATIRFIKCISQVITSQVVRYDFISTGSGELHWKKNG